MPENKRLNKPPLHYIRQKGKVELKGDPSDVKWPMWFDLITTKLFWIVPVVALLFLAPKVSFIPILWQWVKKSIPLLILFAVAVHELQLSLSG